MITGQTINNYLLERKLGEGGMGEVYYARHNRIERQVAIKILHKNLFAVETIRSRFKNEANALIKLEHPNIVKIYDYIEHENFACLIVEYIDGITLDDYINKFSGPLSDTKIRAIMYAVLNAVQYAHDQGVFHRDIKPGNIMIGRDSKTVKVMDFGIAKFSGNNSHNITQVHTQLGTPFYMSPEQIKGLPYSAQSDIYSLGVTLFEMATGKCPYLGINSLFELQSKIVNEPLPSTDVYYPEVLPVIQEAISIATRKDPEQRFKTCNEFKKFLEEKNENIILPVSPVVKISKLQQPKSKAPYISNANKILNKEKKKSGFLGYVTVLILLFSAIAIFFVFQSVSKKPDDFKEPSLSENQFLKNHIPDEKTIPGPTNYTHPEGINLEKISNNQLNPVLNDENNLPPKIKSPEINFSTPTKREVINDLLRYGLSNGIKISGTLKTENDYFPAIHNNVSQTFWTGSFKFWYGDTLYKTIFTYKLDGDSYKYSKNVTKIENIANLKAKEPVPLKDKDPPKKPGHNPIEDLKKRLENTSIFCGQYFNFKYASGYRITINEKESEGEKVIYQIAFNMDGIPKKCNVVYNYDDNTKKYKEPIITPICD